MSKSLRAKIICNLLKPFAAYIDKNSARLISRALSKGERPTSSPKKPKTRFVDCQNGRVFFANEGSNSNCVVFYLHGGAYYMDITKYHWTLLDTVVRETDVQLVVPAYRLVPFATYKEAFALIVPLYQEFCENHGDKKIVLMGDSAGGGLALALAEHFKAEGMRLPDRMILLSPWVDASMDNEEIKEYEKVDPLLRVGSLRDCAERWKGNLDVHDWHISPIYGDLQGIRNVTIFVGTDGILYPDIIKCFRKLDDDPTNELIIGEEMNHDYPLFPIPEAKPAVDKIIKTILLMS